jgi:hypothetical protein
MKTNTLTNKFKGYCGCGKLVEAGAGFYQWGTVFCDIPNDLNYCPTQQARNEANLEAQQQMQNDWYNNMSEDQKNAFASEYANHKDGTCGKCEGSRKYIYASGAIGICYQCDGVGKITKAGK